MAACLFCKEANERGERDADMDGYQQAQAVRKSRSDRFLKDDKSPFALLSLLTLQFIVQRIIRVAFRMANSDRDKMGFPRDGADLARAKRRRKFRKGPHIMAEDVEQRVYTLSDLLSACKAVLRDLWKLIQSDEKRSIWCVAAAYWPASSPRDEMLASLTLDMFKAISGLKFRLTSRFAVPPLSLLGAQVNTDETLNAFMKINCCCLDPHWGRPVRDDVNKEVEDPAGLLNDHVMSYEKHARAVSVREEASHALQRKLAGGWVSRPRAFYRQSAGMVLSVAGNHYQTRGGRKLDSAASGMKDRMRLVRQNKVKVPRPKQLGSGMFLFISHKLKSSESWLHMVQVSNCLTVRSMLEDFVLDDLMFDTCPGAFAVLSCLCNLFLTSLDFEAGSSREQWRAVWRGMSDAEKATWQARHRFAVASRRQRVQLEQQEQQQDTPCDNMPATPWKLGDENYPLTTQWVQNLLSPFSSRATGLSQLEGIETPEAQQARANPKYHSGDAATAKCKSLLGSLIDDQTPAQTTWNAVQAAPVPEESCFNLHPGLCASRDELVVKNLTAFMSRVPKRSAILRFERSGCRANMKVVIFVRTLVGKGASTYSDLLFAREMNGPS